ncbi:hypothetical protein KKHLCK_13555 [Candidatus Electrothrix laxa]
MKAQKDKKYNMNSIGCQQRKWTVAVTRAKVGLGCGMTKSFTPSVCCVRLAAIYNVTSGLFIFSG